MDIHDKYLGEVRARLNATTRGPWRSYVEGRDHTSGSDFIMTAGEDINLIGAKPADQDFIANARQDVEILLDEVQRLRALKSN